MNDTEQTVEYFDSGYTEDELDALFEGLAKKAKFTWPDQPMALALAIGLSDGDVVQVSERGTVMLETPREEIDRRIAAIKAKIKDGAALDEAIEAVVG